MLKIMIDLTNLNMCGVIEFLIEKKKNDWTDLLCTGCDNYYPPTPHPLNNTRNLSQTCFPDQSDMGLHWKHMGFCHQGPVWHLLLLNILRSFQVSFALPNATFHLSIDGPISSFRLLWHILSFICLCYLKKKKKGERGREHIRDEWPSSRKPKAAATAAAAAAAAPRSHFSSNWKQLFKWTSAAGCREQRYRL